MPRCFFFLSFQTSFCERYFILQFLPAGFVYGFTIRRGLVMSNSDVISLRDHGLEAYDLTRASSELSKQASSLFLPAGNLSQLEIHECTPRIRDESLAFDSTTYDDGQDQGTISVSYLISAVDDLLKILKVSLQSGESSRVKMLNYFF